MMNAAVKFLGTSDEVTTCDCCGKQNLKSTVAISINDADPVYYGVTCAAHALKVGVKEVRTGTRAADQAKADAERAEQQRVRAAELAAWAAFLEQQTGIKGDIFRSIEKLGGYAAASALYKSRV